MLNFKQKLAITAAAGGIAGAWIASQWTGATFGFDPRLGGLQVPLPREIFDPLAIYYPLSIYGMAAAADYWPAAMLRGLAYATLASTTALAGCAYLIRDAVRGGYKPKAFGQSAWGTRSDAVKAGFIAGEGPAKHHKKSPFTFVLGEAFNTTLTVTDDRFVGLFLPTRGGKSRLLAVNLLAWKSSAFVFLSGALKDVWTWTSGYRATIGDVVLLDLGNPNGWRYNPLVEIRKGTMFEWDDCKVVAAQLPIQKAHEARIPFWITAPVEIISALIRYVIHMAPPEERNLGNVRDLAGLPVKAIAKILEKSPHKNIQEMAIQLKEADPEKVRELLSAVKNYLSPWDSEAIREVTKESDFSMCDLMAGMAEGRKMTLYIRVPDTMTNEWSTIVKVLFAQARKAMMHHEDMLPDGREKEHDVGFFFDEFASITDKETETDIAKLAKYGGHVFLCTQSPQTLKSFGENQTISQNLTVQMFGASGDPKTQKELEDALGDVTEIRQAQSRSAAWLNPIPQRKSRTQAEAVRKLLNSGEIRSLPFDEMLVLPTGHPPFRVKKIMNLEHREPWASMVLPPAPIAPPSRTPNPRTAGAFI